MESKEIVTPLNVSDIDAVTEMLAVALRREAFTPEEKPEVITVHNKLIEFLRTVNPEMIEEPKENND